ncbi:type II/IV secretion system ATPase subunit [candidate division KSB1 bacterium]
MNPGKKSSKKTGNVNKGKSSSKTLIDSYEISSEGMKAKVKIEITKSKLKKYMIHTPVFSPPTMALIEEIKRGLVSEMSFSAKEILDVKIINELKERVTVKATELLKKHLHVVDENTKTYVTGTLIHEMLGLKEVEFLLSDPRLEEIRINSALENIRVYHKTYGWLETNQKVPSEADIQNYGDIIARRVGKQINVLNPLLDAHLITGDRVNVVLYPITTKGNTITIRKFARDPWTVTDFIKNNTVNSEIMALIWLATEYEMNILVSGGTGSGKTSFINICMPFIPPNQSIISIEDTRELQLPKYLYWTPMVTRLAGAEGKGEITMLNLLINSLRMRPDRIIMGEIRQQRDAQVLFEAMHTGHSVYSTLHADSLSETISRLVNPPIAVPKNLISSVDLCVVMFRDRRKGVRRIYQVGEFTTEGGDEEEHVKANMLYRWKPSTDKIIPHGSSLRLFEDLSRHTGLTQKDINKDLAEKKMILEWLVRNNIRKINEVGKVINDYYLDKDSVINVVKKNLDKNIILKK